MCMLIFCEFCGSISLPITVCIDRVCAMAIQVYTAEEKAALAMYNFEENKKKEQKILADMQELVQRTLGDDEEPDAE